MKPPSKKVASILRRADSNTLNRHTRNGLPRRGTARQVSLASLKFLEPDAGRK